MARTYSLTKTLEVLRDLGAVVGITERWNQYARKRQDLFGFIDAIAMFPPPLPVAVAARQRRREPGITVAVQACGEDLVGHLEKIAENPAAVCWLLSRNLIRVASWRKVKAVRGGKRKVWKPRWFRAVLTEKYEIRWEQLTKWPDGEVYRRTILLGQESWEPYHLG